MQSWIRDLKDAGGDLQGFGRREKKGWITDGVEREWSRLSCAQDWNGHCWKLVGFEYGPRPEDWSVWIYDWNKFFTDFWNLVEHSVELMPGTWPGEWPGWREIYPSMVFQFVQRAASLSLLIDRIRQEAVSFRSCEVPRSMPDI